MSLLYRTVIILEVLSEGPIPDGMELDDIYKECGDGAYSGKILAQEEEVITRQEMENYLIAQGSTPDFFFLPEEEIS